MDDQPIWDPSNTMTPYIDTKSVHSKSEAMAELSHIDENIMLNEAAEFSGKESPDDELAKFVANQYEWAKKQSRRALQTIGKENPEAIEIIDDEQQQQQQHQQQQRSQAGKRIVSLSMRDNQHSSTEDQTDSCKRLSDAKKNGTLSITIDRDVDELIVMTQKQFIQARETLLPKNSCFNGRTNSSIQKTKHVWMSDVVELRPEYYNLQHSNNRRQQQEKRVQKFIDRNGVWIFNHLQQKSQEKILPNDNQQLIEQDWNINELFQQQQRPINLSRGVRIDQLIPSRQLFKHFIFQVPQRPEDRRLAWQLAFRRFFNYCLPAEQNLLRCHRILQSESMSGNTQFQRLIFVDFKFVNTLFDGKYGQYYPVLQFAARFVDVKYQPWLSEFQYVKVWQKLFNFDWRHAQYVQECEGSIPHSKIVLDMIPEARRHAERKRRRPDETEQIIQERFIDTQLEMRHGLYSAVQRGLKEQKDLVYKKLQDISEEEQRFDVIRQALMLLVYGLLDNFTSGEFNEAYLVFYNGEKQRQAITKNTQYLFDEYDPAVEGKSINLGNNVAFKLENQTQLNAYNYRWGKLITDRTRDIGYNALKSFRYHQQIALDGSDSIDKQKDLTCVERVDWIVENFITAIQKHSKDVMVELEDLATYSTKKENDVEDIKASRNSFINDISQISKDNSQKSTFSNLYSAKSNVTPSQAMQSKSSMTPISQQKQEDNSYIDIIDEDSAPVCYDPIIIDE